MVSILAAVLASDPQHPDSRSAIDQCPPDPGLTDIFTCEHVVRSGGAAQGGVERTPVVAHPHEQELVTGLQGFVVSGSHRDPVATLEQKRHNIEYAGAVLRVVQ